MFSTEPGSRFRLAAASAAIGFLAGALVVAVAGVAWELRHSASAAVSPPPTPDVNALPVIESDPLADLRRRNLEMPVLGASRDALRTSFDEARSGSRTHEAIDILAALGTPVVAVEDGIIAKLFLSDAGGITVYLFDPTGRYAYYYAHLDRYAGGLADGMPIKRGQVLGYVGVTGNAPKSTPHLHFAIFKLTDAKHWWQGTPIDPFQVLR